MQCQICSNKSDNRELRAREMMFGYRDAFTYLLCGRCGCLQLATPPADLSRYYPPEYYSFHPVSPVNPLRRLLVGVRDRYAVFGGGPLGRRLFAKWPNVALRSFFPLRLSREARVLDVGCGSGALLLSLHRLGFTRLVGTDPFIEAEIRYPGDVIVYRKPLADMAGSWDLITFHHSFEHIPDPEATLHRVSERLNPGGRCLIRIPTTTSYAWEHYGVDWVQLDAPRHYFLHSVESMRILGGRVGLDLEEVKWDSTGFQFWGSEQYRKDIPLRDPRSVAENPQTSIFPPEQLHAWDLQAERLNREGKGDQAAFYFRKISR